MKGHTGGKAECMMRGLQLVCEYVRMCVCGCNCVREIYIERERMIGGGGIKREMGEGDGG